MAKDVINVGGEKIVVREDKAKRYRGMLWGLLTLGMILAITFIMFVGGFIKVASDGNLDKSPAEIETQRK